MKLNAIVFTGGVFLASLFFTSCNKYEDGPGISLIPRKDRVANTWIIEKAYADNEDVTDDYRVYEIYLSNDGDAEITGEFSIFGQDFAIETDGTWEFYNDENNIRFDYENDDADNEYQILRLTEDEFWVREVGGEVELHLAEK